MAHIRAMNRTEVQELVRWADAEGWNPGLHDADFFWQADPLGFLAAEEDGELAGAVQLFAIATSSASWDCSSLKLPAAGVDWEQNSGLRAEIYCWTVSLTGA